MSYDSSLFPVIENNIQIILKSDNTDLTFYYKRTWINQNKIPVVYEFDMNNTIDPHVFISSEYLDIMPITPQKKNPAFDNL